RRRVHRERDRPRRRPPAVHDRRRHRLRARAARHLRLPRRRRHTRPQVRTERRRDRARSMHVDRAQHDRRRPDAHHHRHRRRDRHLRLRRRQTRRPRRRHPRRQRRPAQVPLGAEHHHRRLPHPPKTPPRRPPNPRLHRLRPPLPGARMTTTTAPPMLQNHVEFQQLLDLYVERGPERVLEVGVGEGGTLWRWLLYAAAGARVVALDDRHLNRDAYPSWTPDSVELVTITGSSHDPAVLLDVAGYRPFDFIFIDADHHDHAVRADWRHFSA